MSLSPLPVLQPRLLLGLQTQVKGNIKFISDDEVIYPVGGVLCIHNHSQRRQKFIKLPEKGANVNFICMSPNRKFLAVLETGEKPSLSIYDPIACKKKKQIFVGADKEIQSRELVAACFTCDSKQIIVVSGEPDWLMFVYRVDKGRLDSVTRANNSNNTGTVVQVAANPNDSNLVLLVGNQLFRNLSCSENNWRQFGFSKAETMNILCCTWISQDRSLCGTSDGRILFFENADLKAIFLAAEVSVLLLKIVEDPNQATGSVQNVCGELSLGSMMSFEGNEVSRIVAFSKGLLITHMTGNIHYFDKESSNKYRKRCIYKIPDHNIERSDEEKNEEFEDYSDTVFNTVNSIAVNVSEDSFLVTCNEVQIYTARISVSDSISAVMEVTMTEFGINFHHGPIGGLGMCSWRPVFMTTGVWDRTLRIWNYETETLELVKKYTEDIFGCDLHPTGLFAVIGFANKIRYVKILIDDFVVTREYPIRACRLCKFSNLGHLFAAINGNVIQVYSSITFEHMFNLKGHNGIVTGLSWEHSDSKLTSCGTEGAVYEWQISSTRRISETIIKSCQFSSIVTTSDGKSTFAVGSDGRIREIVNSNVYGDISVASGGLDCVEISKSDAMLFASGNSGNIYSVLIPFVDTPVYSEFTVHSSKCQAIKISYDDKFLVSISTSSICLWKITNADGKQFKMDKEFKTSTEVMIDRLDLIDKMSLIKDLQLRMNELQMEHAYQMRQKDAANNAALMEMQEDYESAIEELKEKNENLEQEHNQEISNINIEINKMKSAHELFVQKLEANYNEKLITEYNKFILLEEKLSRMRLRYDKELEELAEAKRLSEDTITRNYEQKLQEKEVNIEELEEKINTLSHEHEAIKQQIEDDADREIYETKTQFEKELREEQDLNVRLRGETQASKKKLQASQKSIDDLNHTVHMHEIEQHKLKGVIFGLEVSMGDLKKEILERDSTIQDKEKRTSELKVKNMELEKFKFILEFKIDELKAQIEPRDRTIREQTEQINDMVNELENLQKIVLSLELQLSELREKLKAANNEVKREVQKNRDSKANLTRIKTEIHHASSCVHDIPKLQKAVREMYQKYDKDKDFAVTHAEDVEAKREFLRQREFLERTVKTLKGQVIKSQSHTGENLRLVEQNSMLIAETNNLRKNLKTERRDNKRMNALLGLNKVVNNYSEGQRKLDQAVATRNEIRQEYRDTISEQAKCIEVLTDEFNRLQNEITATTSSKTKVEDQQSK